MRHYSPALRAQLSQYRKRKNIPLGGAIPGPRPQYHDSAHDAATFYARPGNQGHVPSGSIYDAPAEYQWQGPEYELPPSWFEPHPPASKSEDRLPHGDPLELTPHPPINEPDASSIEDIWSRFIDSPNDAVASETNTYDSDHELTQEMFDQAMEETIASAHGMETLDQLVESFLPQEAVPGQTLDSLEAAVEEEMPQDLEEELFNQMYADHWHAHQHMYDEQMKMLMNPFGMPGPPG